MCLKASQTKEPLGFAHFIIYMHSAKINEGANYGKHGGMSKQASKQCCNVLMINPHVMFGVGEMLKRCFSSWFYFYLQYSMSNTTLELSNEQNDIEKNHDSDCVCAVYMIKAWSLLLYIQSVSCKHGCNVVIGWTLSQFDRDGFPQVQGIRIYSGLSAYSIHKEEKSCCERISPITTS